ncbi:MAG: sigma-70 family RNA polymerase sigma factor [Myxococcaceae bacterium]|nr:sigma-70 family RNA polymerase sigma factor [Myxococcaceae bacterium]
MTNEALGQLYTRYGAYVHRRCRALMGNDADANDALQETFMRVQRYPPGEDVMALLPWLYTVAARVCFDQLAHRRRAEPMGLLGRVTAWFDRPTTGSVEEKLCLGGELARLDETTREMAMLHWLDGLTQDEVATKTGYSRKTVGVKLKSAEGVLREALRGGVT